jgi:hypothetical protein
MELNPKDISDRIKTYLKQKHKTVSNGVRILGKDPVSARNSFLKGETLPASDVILQLFIDGCDLHWLITGETKTLSVQEKAIPYFKIGSITQTTNGTGKDMQIAGSNITGEVINLTGSGDEQTKMVLSHFEHIINEQHSIIELLKKELEYQRDKEKGKEKI